MKGLIVRDWSQVDFRNPEHRRLVFGAVQHFMSVPQENSQVRAALQNFATTGDFPTSVLQILEKYRLEATVDNAWELAFDVRDFTGSQRNGFKILDVENGLTFERVPVGDHANIYKMAGTEVTVNFQIYGGGLGWHRTLMDDREYWTMEDNAIAFRNKSMAAKAQVHYDLIEAVPASQDLAWQAVTPAGVANTNENYNAIRDINTINKACEDIIVALAGKGMGVSASTSFLCLAPIQLRARLTRAAGLLNQSISGSQRGLVYNVSFAWTQMFRAANATTRYYIMAPKIKMKSGNRMNLTVFEKFDETSYSDIAVGWYRFGAAIGDIDQIRRCATA